MVKSVKAFRDKMLGKEFETLNFGKCFIIDYKGANDVTVMFYEPVCVVKTCIQSLRSGKVRNPFYPSFYGKGFIGVGKYGYKDKIIYKLWTNMLERSFCPFYKTKAFSYRDVSVCDEWLDFQTFAKWCDSQKFFSVRDYKGKRYHLDKDILVKGNKVYSPETCCFVPEDVNNLLVSCKKSRGDYPVGVVLVKSRGDFVANLSCFKKRKHLGYFSTCEEAFEAYKVAKEVHIKVVANMWRGKVDEEVYESLLKYEVDVGD